jgi:hypothetical protein
VGVPDAELEQLLKGMALHNLNVHKVGMHAQPDWFSAKQVSSVTLRPSSAWLLL